MKKLVVFDSPLLAAVSIDLPSVEEDEVDEEDKSEEDEVDEEDKSDCNLVKAFGRARNINTLTLLGYSLTFLGLSGVPKTISLIFNHLHVLTMAMDFDIDKEIKMTLCLLRASPNIEQVEIIGASHKQQEVVAEDEFWAEEGDFEIGEFWALQDFLDLSKLRILKLTNVTVTRQLVDFMAFLLPKAQQLETLMFNVAKPIEESKFRKLLDFVRAYTQAEIIPKGNGFLLFIPAL